MGDPIQLRDSGTIIGTLTTGYLRSPQPLLLGSKELQARFIRQPVSIRRLKFLAVVQNAYLSSSPPLIGFTPSAYVRVRIKAGRHVLTNDYVPLSVLSGRVNDAIEFTGGPGSTNHASVFSRCNWNFDRPLALGQGEAITIEAIVKYPSNDIPAAIVLTGPWLLYVVAEGETIDKMPARYMVPYATSYVGQIGTPVSQENDLRNVTGAVLEVRRLIGRSLFGTLSASDEYWQDYTQLPATAQVVTSPPGGADPAQTAIVHIYDENNKQLQQHSSGVWIRAFPEDSLTWPMSKKLAAGWSWRVQLPNTYPIAPTASPTYGWIPQIGMIGFREESGL